MPIFAAAHFRTLRRTLHRTLHRNTPRYDWRILRCPK
jgi:hypothetical protein